MHFFLTCPLYVAQRVSLLTSAARICGNVWTNCTSKKQKLEILLFGCNDLDLEENHKFFFEVQKYILSTDRFSVSNV